MFAYLKDRHGEWVTVAAEPRVQSVLRSLAAQGVETKSCRLSVNLAFPVGDAELAEDDELALIPPVSGG